MLDDQPLIHLLHMPNIFYREAIQNDVFIF